jgi:hypothetical protein
MGYSAALIKALELAPEDVMGPAALALQRELCLNEFDLFARFALGYSDIDREAHKETVHVLESDAARKLVILPRGTFKSSLCDVAYPMWRLEKDPDLTILIDSEIFNNSKNFLREIKGHYQSDRYRLIFGDRAGSKWGESEITVSTRKRNRKEASITVGGLGTVKVGQHYDLIIGDDYNSPQNSDTVEKCQKVIDHVRYNLNILNPGGEYVFVGTRYAERDVLGFLLSDVLKEKHLAEGKLKMYEPGIDAEAEVLNVVNE